jgi:hypothetical protein
MARSTFEGPILSGDNRFGNFRNVGYTTLTQNGYLDLLNLTPNTVGYSGGSGQPVDGNIIPNSQGVIYTPSSTVPYTSSAIVTPTADTTSNIYRTYVMYIPTGSDIDQALIDVAVVPTGGTITTIKMYISNTFCAEGSTPTYCATGNITAVGRQAVTFSGTQVTNCNNTSTDLVGVNNSQSLSQIVFTLSIAASATLVTPTAGQIYIALRYVQSDGNIGTATAYPYGNFD